MGIKKSHLLPSWALAATSASSLEFLSSLDKNNNHSHFKSVSNSFTIKVPFNACSLEQAWVSMVYQFLTAALAMHKTKLQADSNFYFMATKKYLRMWWNKTIITFLSYSLFFSTLWMPVRRICENLLTGFLPHSWMLLHNFTNWASTNTCCNRFFFIFQQRQYKTQY